MRCGFSFGLIMNYVAVVSPYAASGSVFVGHDILSGVRQASDEAYRYLPVWHQLEINQHPCVSSAVVLCVRGSSRKVGTGLRTGLYSV